MRMKSSRCQPMMMLQPAATAVSASRSHLRCWLAALALIVLGAAAFANSLDGPFVYDDDISIVHNDRIRQLWPPWGALFSAPSTPVAGRPVVSLTLAINYAAGGLDARGYHLVNLAIHLGCALVLYGIVRRTLIGPRFRQRFATAATPLAFACALIWMVHPVQTECVNYITQRTESIMALFYLLTLYCAIRALDSPRRRWWTAASVLCCALGMASKEVMVTAPLMVLLYDRAYGEGPFGALLRKRVGLYAGLGATWGVLAVLMATGPRSATIGFAHGVSAWDYALHQCVMIVHYLRLAVWPSPLILDYGFPTTLSIAEAAPWAALLAGLLVATLVLFVARPALGYPAVWFFAILAPTSSVVPIITEVGAERRIYLSLAGLVVLGVVVGFVLLRRAAGVVGATGRAVVAAVLLIAIVASLSAATWRRNDAYGDRVGIWLAAVERVPANHRARTNLGIALAAGRDVEGAIHQFHEALRINPDSGRAHYNLANALASRGRTLDAVEHYRAALADDPDSFEARYNLAIALAQMARLEEAIEQFRLALAVRDRDAAAHYNLGKALAVTGRPREALRHLRTAIELDPNWPALLRDTAWLLSTYPDAEIRDGAEALSLAGRASMLTGWRDPRLLDTMAAASAEVGRFQRALELAEAALTAAVEVGDETLAVEIRARAELYRQGQPYRVVR